MNEALKALTRGETDEERKKRIQKEEEAEQKAAEAAKKSPYQRFLQANKNAYKEEDWLMRESPAAYRLLRFIAQNMDNYNALVCSYRVFQEALGYSTSTITRAISLLREHNFIAIAKSGTTNVYFINKNLYWNSYGTNYAYAEFGAKIIVTASEQDKEEQEQIKLEVKNRREKRGLNAYNHQRQCHSRKLQGDCRFPKRRICPASHTGQKCHMLFSIRE